MVLSLAQPTGLHHLFLVLPALRGASLTAALGAVRAVRRPRRTRPDCGSRVARVRLMMALHLRGRCQACTSPEQRRGR